MRAPFIDLRRRPLGPRATRPLRFSTLCLLAGAALACGGDTGPGPMNPDPMEPDPMEPMEPPPPAAPVVVGTADLENFGDARDVEITFRETGDAAEVDEYRIYVVRSAAAGDDPPLTGTPETAAPAAGDIVVRLTASVTDEAGDPLEEEVAYVSYVQAWTGVADESPVSPASNPFTLVRTDIVESVASLDAGTGGVEVDADGNIYVADFGTQLSGGVAGTRLYRVTPEGDVSVFAEGFGGASGNAFDSQGNLFQSNIARNTIDLVEPDGTVTEFASGPAIVGPVGIAVAAGDTLYVANCNNNTIAKVAPDGTSSTFSDGPLYVCPNGIALADDGNFYVANFSNGSLLRVAPDGTASTFLTFATNNLGHVTFGNGVLYVAVRGLHRIYEVALDGDSRVVAGTGARGRADGPALQATLSFTNDIALSPDGSVLYFNDVDPSTASTNVLSPSWLRKVRLEAPSE